MNLMSVLLLSKINLLNNRTIWFIKTFSFVLRLHFPKTASSGSSFGSERKPAQCLPKNLCFVTLTKKMQYIFGFF